VIDQPSLAPEYATASDLAGRIDSVDWWATEQALATRGYSLTGPLLDAAQCEAVAMLYAQEERFRCRTIARHHALDRSERQYFQYPLPALVNQMRERLYRHLAPIANRRYPATSAADRFPARQAVFTQACHAAGQGRPAVLMSKHSAPGYCTLNGEARGGQVFPIQVIVFLSRPGAGAVIQVAGVTRDDACLSAQGQAVIVALDQVDPRHALHFNGPNVCNPDCLIHRPKNYSLQIAFHDFR